MRVEVMRAMWELDAEVVGDDYTRPAGPNFRWRYYSMDDIIASLI